MTLDYIDGIEFTKSVSGYRPGEVDDFIDTVSSGFKELLQENAGLKANIDTLSALIEEYRGQENSIHSALLSAQKLADNIVSEANAAAEKTVREAEERAAQINAETDADHARRQKEFNDRLADLDNSSRAQAKRLVDDANAKSAAIFAAAEDSVRLKQIAFDSLKRDASVFKADLMRLYQSHIELINRIPEVAQEPEAAAKSAAKSFVPAPEESVAAADVKEPEAENVSPTADKPDDESFAEPQEIQPIELPTQPIDAADVPNEDIWKLPDAVEEKQLPPRERKSGFKIRVNSEDEEEETFAQQTPLKFGSSYDLPDDAPENDEAAGFGFFRKKK
ncbi:MAG: DivIVA domain-containing protein [Oscillospiraceae bacterium]|jgi:DivIVA domain-containing protein|nr:DivIVA domain-containing protein [Oscillospiraceae bacterium]